MARYSLFKLNKLRYPDVVNSLYRPNTAYPEYPFPADTCVSEQNDVYAAVRELLYMSELDRLNYGTKKWNPLGKFIHPGMNVLIKPNLVMHVNPTGYGTECLYTHPSVIAATIDYVVIALRGEGKIVLADAPMQSCDFEILVKQSNLRELVKWYRAKGVDIELRDLRGLKSVTTGLGLKQSIVDGVSGKVVDLGCDSSFVGLSPERMDSLRITNYNPADLKRHHTLMKHEYYISDALLNADIIVNLPKAKTHRKAGITGALKNMVGVNVRKEYLPHHSNGALLDGFDEYEKPCIFKRLNDDVLDLRNSMLGKSPTAVRKMMSLLARFLRLIGEKVSGDSFNEGGWYGNDTIWRTVLDLNKIVFYSNKEGVLCNERQRRMIVICDMVTIGEGEGPLFPRPASWGMLAFSDDPVVHDVALARLMGTDESLIPIVHQALLYNGAYSLREYNDTLPKCISNDKTVNGIVVDKLNKDMNYNAIPSSGWTSQFTRRNA